MKLILLNIKMFYLYFFIILLICCNKQSNLSYYNNNFEQIKQEILIANILKNTNLIINPLEINTNIENITHKIIKENMNDLEKARVIFNYLVKNISYNSNFKINKEQTAIQTLINKKANCTQYSYLFLAMSRIVNLNIYFADIYVDQNNQIVEHTCVCLITNSSYIFIDPTYQIVDVKHKKFRILNDKETIGSFYNNLHAYYNLKKDYSNSIELLKTSILLYKNNPKSYINLGKVYQYEKKYELALKYFFKGIEIYKKLSINHPGIKDSYFDIGDIYLCYLKKYKKAIKSYKKAISILPVREYEHQLYSNIGSAYIDLDEFNKALLYFKKSLRINPDYYAAYNGLGLIYYKKNKYNEAEKFYKKAIEKNNNYIQAILNLVELLLLEKKYDDAIKLLQNSIKNNLKNYKLYNSLGHVYCFNKDYRSAEKYLKKSLELKSDYLYAINNLILVYIKFKKFDKAKIYLEKSFLIKKNNEGYYYCYALYWSVLNNKEKAISFLKKIKVDFFNNPDEIDYYFIKEDGFDNIKNKKEFIKFVNCLKKEIEKKKEILGK